jgi:hypothetical protein
MARCFVAVALLAVSWLVSGASNSYAAPCFIVTLTGTRGDHNLLTVSQAPERWCALAMTPMNVGR